MHRFFLFHAFDCGVWIVSSIHDFTQSAPCNIKLAVSTLYTHIYICIYIFLLNQLLTYIPFHLLLLSSLID